MKTGLPPAYGLIVFPPLGTAEKTISGETLPRLIIYVYV
jgi:hypothetical protein